MRLVPLIIGIGLFANASARAEEYQAYGAGRSHAVRKLNNDGISYEIKGDFLNARKCFDEAVRVDPTMWPAYVNRASLDLQEHKFRQAVDDATMALRIRSSFNESAVLRAEANIHLRNYDSALRDINQLLSLGERGNAYAHALNVSAWLRATCPDSRVRNGQLAMAHASRAVSLTSTSKSEFMDTLAVAYAEIGNFEAAIRTEEKAMSLAKTPQLIKEDQEHIAAFRQHRPWRDKS